MAATASRTIDQSSACSASVRSASDPTGRFGITIVWPDV